MTRVLRLIVLVAFIVPVLGCEQPTTAPTTQDAPQPQSLPTVQMTLGSRTYTLEIAATDDRADAPAEHAGKSWDDLRIP
ncbi:MAG TPA: hypothetical protein PKB10_04030 [Tepidisphaeraceae bacterium]|nr:hypothetical protein [Tepidisphaeraceae bacterium]